jgi:hypothetical protein
MAPAPPAPVTAKTARRALSQVSLVAAGAGVGLIAVALMFMIGSPGLSHPTSHPVNAETTPATPPSVSEPVVHVGQAPPWIGRRQAAWGFDGTKTIAFTMDESGDVPIGTARARPQLGVRCLARHVDLYVVTGPLTFEPQSATHTVAVQIDDDPERTEQWIASESSQEVFAPDGLGSVRRLAGAHRMRFKYTPFHAKPVNVDFVVEGFDQLAPLVARTCGTRLDPTPRQAPARSN